MSRSSQKSSHSMRVPDAVWASAQRRATAEGTTMNGMLNEFVEGYARGLINLPRVTKTYSPMVAPKAAPAPAPEAETAATTTP
jgi:hypothetical protein